MNLQTVYPGRKLPSDSFEENWSSTNKGRACQWNKRVTTFDVWVAKIRTGRGWVTEKEDKRAKSDCVTSKVTALSVSTSPRGNGTPRGRESYFYGKRTILLATHGCRYKSLCQECLPISDAEESTQSRTCPDATSANISTIRFSVNWLCTFGENLRWAASTSRSFHSFFARLPIDVNGCERKNGSGSMKNGSMERERTCFLLAV